MLTYFERKSKYGPELAHFFKKVAKIAIKKYQLIRLKNWIMWNHVISLPASLLQQYSGHDNITYKNTPKVASQIPGFTEFIPKTWET